MDCVNKFIPGRTKKEYYEANKEKRKEYYKEYREANKEKNKEYREINKEKRKEYREINKDKMKEYYQENKEKILSRQKEKITCDCGSILRQGDKARHNRTTKHQNFIKD